MQIPIISGIYANSSSDFRTSYPRNLIPVPKEQGISNGYLRPAEGIFQIASLPGLNRGAINWNGQLYVVAGNKLCKILSNNEVVELGIIPGNSQVSIDYSFDRLAIAANRELYYFDGTNLNQVTDNDLGECLDVIWIDGYFMTTDGNNLVVTELDDPEQVNALKYGSSEIDPDPVKSLLKLNGEVYALNRYTTEAFSNVGGEFFPFQRIDGAMLNKGSIGTHTCCEYMGAIAFLGSGRNEPLSIWLGSGGNVQKIATREIDQIIHQYPEDTLENAVLLETRAVDGHIWLYVHLPDSTLVYDAAASQIVGQPVWFILSSGIGETQYQARNHVWCYDRWIVGHSTLGLLGELTNETSEHWGAIVEWQFGTQVIYNESFGAIFHEIELVALAGRVAFGNNPEPYRVCRRLFYLS
ncbi:packaged DNA stabilization protein [Acinetobacter pittii]|uniref:packaged DNA stabilization protein n=1 Tax=Acinetobacter pittii TaxID=48296 RepID=UPI0032B325D2